MRVAKFSDKEFADVPALTTFFAGVPNRTPPGLILIPERQISTDGLIVGEWVLFTFLGRLRYVARAASGRQENTFEPRAGYPHCFVIDPASIRHVDMPVSEVEQLLRNAGVERSLDGQGWTTFYDERADAVIEALAQHAAEADPAPAPQ